jgi:hypothetical protein
MGAVADASVRQLGASECRVPRRFIAVSFHRLFLSRLLPSRACLRFVGCIFVSSSAEPAQWRSRFIHRWRALAYAAPQPGIPGPPQHDRFGVSVVRCFIVAPFRGRLPPGLCAQDVCCERAAPGYGAQTGTATGYERRSFTCRCRLEWIFLFWTWMMIPVHERRPSCDDSSPC